MHEFLPALHILGLDQGDPPCCCPLAVAPPTSLLNAPSSVSHTMLHTPLPCPCNFVSWGVSLTNLGTQHRQREWVSFVLAPSAPAAGSLERVLNGLYKCRSHAGGGWSDSRAGGWAASVFPSPRFCTLREAFCSASPPLGGKTKLDLESNSQRFKSRLPHLQAV